MAPGSREFNCSWDHCGKSFNRKSDLCRHYRIHTNERPYHCIMKGCNKSFIQRSALTVHLRTHTGEKPHVCDHDGCQKAFSDSSSLARHRRIHTGKRPYICREPACERTFCRKTTLTKHQYRSHPSAATMNRQCSESVVSGQPYQASLSSDRYFTSQQPFYSQLPNSSQEFYPRDFELAQVAIQGAPVTAPQSFSPNPITDLRYAEQVQIMQRFEQNRQAYTTSEYSLQPYTTPYMVNTSPLDHYADFWYKPPTRLLNQPEGASWGFLGVG